MVDNIKTTCAMPYSACSVIDFNARAFAVASKLDSLREWLKEANYYLKQME